MVYPLPYEFVVSGVFKNLPGISTTATVTVPNSVVLAATGRSLVGCGAATITCTQTTSASVILPQQEFEQRLNQTDVRLSRRFKVGKSRLTGNLDVYNLFNSRAPQSISTAWGTLATPTAAAIPNATYNRPTLYLGGRLLKVGGQFDW